MQGTVAEQIDYWEREIKRGIREELSETNMVFDNLYDNIFKNIRWSFARQKYGSTLAPLESAHLLELDIVELVAYEDMLMVDCPVEFNQRMFPDTLYSCLAAKNLVTLDFDFDWHQFTVEVAHKDTKLDLEKFLTQWEIKATLPGVFVAFGIDDTSFNEWMYEYAEAYEKWQADSRRRDLSYQIGGWADFRQDGDQDEYIAQVNTDHGDCGAVYLGLRDGKFHGYEQMC